MTRDEILNMPAGRELDALVAITIMGWQLENGRYYPPGIARPKDWPYGISVPHYSELIEKAWEVMEKAGPYILIPVGIYNNYSDWDKPGRSQEPDYFSWIALPYQSTMARQSSTGNYIDWIEEELTTDMLAETPALAICRLALLTKMEKR